MEKSRILTERLIVRIPEKEDINDIFLMMRMSTQQLIQDSVQ